MAPRDPTRPQLDFPDLTAELITALRLTGQVGLLDFLDGVRPTFLIGIREGVGLTLTTPAFASAGVASDFTQAPAVNAILADTGPLPAGTYDIQVGCSVTNSAGATELQFQHRDAANAANLATWHLIGRTDVNPLAQSMPFNFGYVIGANERLRFQTLVTVGSVQSRFHTYVMTQIRPTP